MTATISPAPPSGYNGECVGGLQRGERAVQIHFAIVVMHLNKDLRVSGLPKSNNPASFFWWGTPWVAGFGGMEASGRFQAFGLWMGLRTRSCKSLQGYPGTHGLEECRQKRTGPDGTDLTKGSGQRIGSKLGPI